MMLYLVTSHRPITGEPLPGPQVVATISADPAIIGCLSPERELDVLAAKMGLSPYTILASHELNAPGHQFDLFAH